jgi:hypothetical protein
LLEEIVDFDGVHEAVASGDDEGDPSPAVTDDGRQLVLQRAEDSIIVPTPNPG